MITPRSLLCGSIVVSSLAVSAWGDIQLSPMFTNHMVLQRDKPCPVAGAAAPGVKVEAIVDGKPVASSNADATGVFKLKLPPLHDAGPHTVEIRAGDDARVLHDVLVGEVWLCSGQSNMEFPTLKAVNGAAEVAQANHPNIRLFHVPHAATDGPAKRIDAKWELCSSESVPQFSAVGYFFGRKLHEDLVVPVGLIESAWGGTPAESWTPLEKLTSLTNLPRASAMAANVEASRLPDAVECFNAANRKWMEATAHVDPGISDEAKHWADPTIDPSAWRPIEMPTDVIKHGVPSGSIIWYRKTIDLPAERAGHDLVLTLGIVDDFDTTYFNGQQVGATNQETPNWWARQRRYVVPAALVKAGENVIAIRNVDLDGTAGLTGPAAVMKATSVVATTQPTTAGSTTRPTGIALTGTWQYRIERPYAPPGDGSQPMRPLPPYKLDSAWTPGTLYNGMISPIGDYPIRGVTWYQGESNAVRSGEYESLLTTLIGSWRDQFGIGDFPFYIVGLANWKAPTQDPNAISEWANIREAQRQTSRKVKNAAMSVTIDIGDTADIHPTNKQEVGRRLALIALAETYGKQLVSRGPTLKSAAFEAGHVVLTFENLGSGLTASNAGDLHSFAVAGDDGKYWWADARIEGDRVIVSAPPVGKPVHVRYAFADNPEASLFNKEGLPAEPFTASK